MDNKDRLKDLVYKYLDGLFEKVETVETEFGIRGMINDEYLLFTYFPEKNTIYFSSSTSRLISLMFGDGHRFVGKYVREYLKNKFNRNFSNAIFLSAL